MRTRITHVLFAALLPLVFEAQVYAQGTTFTYQGCLSANGAPATGIYDLRFTIYDSSGGATAIAGPLTGSGVGVTGGLFTVSLDFGIGVFTGPARWLQIAVRTNGATTFANLTPRQALTPAPYAIHAGTASTPSVASNVVNGAVVKSLNNLRDNVTLAAGANVTLTQSSNTVTIAAPGGVVGGPWSVNGSSAYYNGGKVGIGTSTPANQLTLRTPNSDYGLEHTDGDIRLSTYVGGSTGGGWLGTISNHKLSFFVNNDGLKNMTLDTTGNVGIGTVSPLFKLQVEGDQFLRGNAYFGEAGRQMLNLFGPGFGIGVQTATVYSRSGGGFAWFLGGTHTNATRNSGGGTTLMTLDNTRGLDFGSRLGQHLSLWGSDGPRRFGIGIQAQTLYSRTGGNAGDGFAWHKGGVHSDNSYDPSGGKTLMTLNEENGITTSVDARQAREKGGWVKGMAKVNADGTISRQYSALGGNITASRSGSSYTVTLAFQVDDRFISVTPVFNESVGMTIAAVRLPPTFGILPNQVIAFISDPDNPDTYLANEFFIFVY